MRKIAYTIVSIFLLAVVFTSCRDNKKTSEEELIEEMKEDGAETKIKSDGDETKIKMETEDKEVKIKKEDGETTIKVEKEND
jgi:ABC-type enterochelin transport system substrate-binding protein